MTKSTGQRRRYPKEIDDQIEALKKQGRTAASIAEELSVPLTKVLKLVRLRNVKLTKEQRRQNVKDHHTRIIPEDLHKEIFRLREDERLSAREIANRLSISFPAVQGVVQKAREEGVVPNIIRDKDRYSKAHTGRRLSGPIHEVQKPVQATLPLSDLTALLSNQDSELLVKVVDLKRKTNYNERTLADQLQLPVRKVFNLLEYYRFPLTKDQREEIVNLRTQEKLELWKIAEKLGLQKYLVKRFLYVTGVRISQEDAQRNAQKGLLASNPGYMDKFRASSQSKEAREKRRAAARVAWADPELRKRNSETSKSVWANATPEQRAAILKNRKHYSQYERAVRNAERALLPGQTFQSRLQEIAAERGGFVVGEYVNSKTLIEMRCKSGHTWEAIPNALHQGSWCPSCAITGPSKAQLEVFEFVRGLLPDTEVLLSDRTAIRPRELDIYIPSIRFGIEYDGLIAHSSYWGDKRGRHLEKIRMCRDSGVTLLAIFEDEWRDERKRSILEDMIRHRAGVSKAIKLDARKLILRSVPLMVARKFFDYNHLEGGSGIPMTEAVGLYDKDETLVMAASFRNNFAGEFELARMATHRSFSVRGGAGKLLSCFRDRDVVTFSNNRLSDGNVYKRLGFELIKDGSDVSYWYTDGTMRIWRARFFKKNTHEIQHLTEEQQCRQGYHSQKIFGDNRALYRIEDYGSRKWIRKSLTTPPTSHNLSSAKPGIVLVS